MGLGQLCDWRTLKSIGWGRCLVGLLCAAWALMAHAGLEQNQIMFHNGVERTYSTYRPEGFEEEPMPLVVLLHGLGGSGMQVLEQGHWMDLSNDQHFMIVAPDGSLPHPDRPAGKGNRRSWNAGPGSGTTAQAQGIDDVGFIADLVQRVEQNHTVNAQRVYVTGFSNGAAMAFYAASKLDGLFKAVAPVSNGWYQPAKDLKTPMSLFMIWGKKDPLNPFDGGKVHRHGKRIERLSARQSLDAWADAIGCRGQAKVTAVSKDVTQMAYRICPDRAQVQLWAVDDLGHQWPGGDTYLRAIAGPDTQAFSATKAIWSFFQSVR